MVKAACISPIVIVPKKNLKIHVCVDYRRLNAATILDLFLLSFTDSLLDEVARKEIYTFLDGFNGYNQVKMAPEDHDKIEDRDKIALKRIGMRTCKTL